MYPKSRKTKTRWLSWLLRWGRCLQWQQKSKLIIKKHYNGRSRESNLIHCKSKWRLIQEMKIRLTNNPSHNKRQLLHIAHTPASPPLIHTWRSGAQSNAPYRGAFSDRWSHCVWMWGSSCGAPTGDTNRWSSASTTLMMMRRSWRWRREWMSVPMAMGRF